MSSNGVMLQDYVPNAINNITERIWCAGAVIPAGKRVVLGNIRNGWREITFTMGLMQDIVGMALVPPEVVAVESIPRMSGVGGMKPRGLGFWQSEPADRPEGWPAVGAPGTGGPVWPVGTPSAITSWGRPQMMPGNVASRHAITSWGKSRAGFGAGGASEFTVKAAEELDEHLTTNGCAGCDDYKSTLRQLAFKFKAACMTDPGVSGQVSFNISTPLAMTAYGVGTDKALTLVLGAKRTYDGGPCTDDNGACLGNMPQIAQVTPVALGPLINQVVSQVNDQIKTQQATPTATQLARQEALVNALVGAATGLLTALSAALAAATPAVVTKPATSPAAAPTKSIWPTVVIGGLIGTTILATGAFIYTHARHA